MPKRTKRKAAKRRVETADDVERRDNRRELQRAKRQEREIAQLARQLANAIVRRDVELEALRRFLTERADPASPKREAFGAGV